MGLVGYRRTKEIIGRTHHLARGHAYGLDGELATAHVKEVLETRTEKVDDEDVVQALLSEVIYLGYPRYIQRQFSRDEESRAVSGRRRGRLTASCENAVGTALVAQLRGLCLTGFLHRC